MVPRVQELGFEVTCLRTDSESVSPVLWEL